MFVSSYLNSGIIKRYSTGRNTYFSMAGVNFSQVMEKKMNKIFSVLLLVTLSFGIISCSEEDPSGATSQLSQVLDQPNSTDDRNNIDIPVIIFDTCNSIDSSTIDNSTVITSSISDNSTIKDSTVRNCSAVVRSIVDNSSNVDNSTITDSTINRSHVCAQSTIDNSTIENSTVCTNSTIRGGSTVRNNSSVCSSTIDNTTIDNATVCDSTFSNRSFKDVTVSDSDVPTVDNVSSNDADALYITGSDITIRVTFSEPVFVNSLSGYPRIYLETGSTQRYAYYSSGNGSNILSFVYTVENGDCVSDLNYKNTDSLDNSSCSCTIIDNSTNEAPRTLPPTDNSNSLGGNKDMYINYDAKEDRC